MYCQKCGQKLPCTLTIVDPFDDENKIIRRRFCYNCRIRYMTKETIYEVEEKIQRRERQNGSEKAKD